jgi:predicted nucleic-acid-binding protein
MRAIDTNVLVRLLTGDDSKQVAAAEAFMAAASHAWVSHVVLVETIWVLDSVYDRQRKEIASAVATLLNHRTLVLQDPDVVEAALGQFMRRSSIKFSDCMVLEIARKAGHLPLGTFDRGLGALDGSKRL